MERDIPFWKHVSERAGDVPLLSGAPERGHDPLPSRSGQVVAVMGVMMGTPNLDWFLSHLGGNLQSEAQKRKRSVFQHRWRKRSRRFSCWCWRVLYLPYLSPSGERAPFVKVLARAQFSGLTVHHTDRHLLRAVLEGVAFSDPGFLRAHARFGSPYQIVGRWSAQRPLGSNHRGCDGEKRYPSPPSRKREPWVPP